MDIKVTGGKGSKIRRIMKEAAEYYGHMLMTRRMAESIDLVVRIRKKLDDEDIDGYCSYEDHENGVRYFEIEIKMNKDLEEMLTVLAHEMTHLKQWATGEMKQGRILAHKTTWKGTTYIDDDVDYWDRPWEIEAFGRERGLFLRYVMTFGYPK